MDAMEAEEQESRTRKKTMTTTDRTTTDRVVKRLSLEYRRNVFWFPHAIHPDVPECTEFPEYVAQDVWVCDDDEMMDVPDEHYVVDDIEMLDEEPL